VSVEIGFFSSLIIFLFIILPGICFRRGYYHGAFTRQFRFSGQGLLTVAYTFVLGLALNFVFIELFNCLQDYDIVVNTELDNFKKLLEDDNQNTSRTSGNSFEGFYESCRNTYWSYLAGIYIFSMLSGFVLNRLVILLGLDLSVRILQFNNEWQYIFDGRKLDQNKQVISRKKFSRRIKYVFVDILTDNGSERGQLYRGLLKNYEINDKDPSKLSSISISKVKRWKRVFDQNKSESWEPVEIPGDLFTILGDRILNVNCHYVKDDKSVKYNWFDVVKLVYLLFMAVINFSLFIMIVFKLGLQMIPFGDEIENRGLFFRVIAAYFISSAFSILTPFDFSDSKVAFSKQTLKIQTISFLITGVLILIMLWI
jgi:hypothetical protein